MPVILILIGSIGWLISIVGAYSMSSNVENAMAVGNAVSSGIGWLWLAFGGLVWKLLR